MCRCCSWPINRLKWGARGATTPTLNLAGQNTGACSSTAEQGTHNPLVLGSNPSRPNDRWRVLGAEFLKGFLGANKVATFIKLVSSPYNTRIINVDHIASVSVIQGNVVVHHGFSGQDSVQFSGLDGQKFMKAFESLKPPTVTIIDCDDIR
jgi:hypothetical protein